MKNVSRDFKITSYAPVKDNFLAEIEFEDRVKYSSSNGLVEWRIINETNFASTAMALATLSFKGEKDVVNKKVSFRFGYDLEEGPELIEFGPFIIQEQHYDVRTNKTTATAYDLMIEFCQQLDFTELEFPCTVKEAIDFSATVVGVPSNISNDLDFIIEEDRYTGTGHEWRSFFEDVAELYNQNIIVKDGVLVNVNKTVTNTYLDKSRMAEYSFEPIFGPVDSLVLSRLPQEDNVYASDVPTEDIEYEVKFADNLLVDNNREAVIDELFLKYKGMEVIPFSINSRLGFVEIGDIINVALDEDDKQLLVYGSDVRVTNSIQERIFCGEPTKTTTKYQYATDSERRALETEMIVDKQKGVIEATINRVEEVEGGLQENSNKWAMTDSALQVEIVDRETQGDYILNELNSQINFTKNEFTISFEELKGLIDGQEDDLSDIRAYFTFTKDDFTIGKNTSPFKVKLSNERLSFMENGREIAYMTGDMLYITDATILNSILLGNHKFEKSTFSYGRTIVRRVS